MCTAENISIDTIQEAHDLPIMALLRTNDPAHQLEEEDYSSCFDFSYHGLSLELERLGSEDILSILPQWTEDQAADFFFSKAVAPITPLSSESLDGRNFENPILDDMLCFLEQNPVAYDDKWQRAWDELLEVELGHDGTTNDDAAQTRSLSYARSRSQPLGGVGQVNGSVLVQDDLEDSIPPAASLPLEHYAWSHPDPAISMSMEEDISQVAEAEILGTPCRKRKARQADESRPCKRARGRPAGSTWRLVEVVSRITPVAQHFCWKRRCALWDDVLGQESWSSEDLSPYVLAGLPFLSLVVRPGGYGFPVPLVWDEKTQRFSGYNAMNQKWVRITCGEMARMLEDPSVGVMVSG
ncbi:hypothetical protein PG995_004813 [Apiospora arundinis]